MIKTPSKTKPTNGTDAKNGSNKLSNVLNLAVDAILPFILLASHVAVVSKYTHYSRTSLASASPSSLGHASFIILSLLVVDPSE